jgi:protein-S-isoprenylcysteine O-methyltransferase Ste14
MDTLLLFFILSIPVVIISWRSLKNFRSHGFYRFFSWECILWLFASNYKYWFIHPFSPNQIVSWILLVLASIVVILGAHKMRMEGKADKSRDDKNLYGFEKTTKLITNGIFKYIRHPLYASLLYLTWGICFKHITLLHCIISNFSSVFLYITARFDEKECLGYFGDAYKIYMQKSKMFIPYFF